MPKSVTLQPNTRLVATSKADIKAAAGEGKKPTFSTMAYAGGAITPDYYYAPAPVVIDLSGLKANEPIAALLDHRDDSIVGQSTSVTIDANGVNIEGILTGDVSNPDDPAGKVALHARNGFVWKTSLGVKITRLEKIEAGETVTVNGRDFTGPGYICRAGEIDEVSFLSVAADKGANAKVAARAARSVSMEFRDWLQARGIDPDKLTDEHRDTLKKDFDLLEVKAKESKPKDAGTDGGGIRAVDPNASLDEVLAGPKLRAARQRRIRELTAQELEVNPGALDFVEATARQAIAEDWTPERFENALLRGRGAGMHINTRPRMADPAEEAKVYEAALCRAGGLMDIEKHYDARVLEACDRRFRHGIGLGELLLCAARANGFSGVSHRDVGPLLRAAFKPAELRAAQGPSTFDLSGILSAAANKFIVQHFMGVENVWQEMAAIRSVTDFKAVTTYSLTGDFTYRKLEPGGEITHGTAGEVSYTNQADTFARMFAIDRRDIINDDLGAFTGILKRMGRGGALAINHEFWTLLFQQRATFFTAARGNAASGADSVLSIDGLTAAEILFLSMTDPDGKPLGLAPAKLVVPVNLKRTALGLMNSTAVMTVQETTAGLGTVTTRPTANTFQGDFQILVSSYMANASYGNSSTRWMLLANPNDMAIMEVCFLNGQRVPTIDQADADFNRLGIQMRAYHDFGVAMQEYRAGVCMEGA
jgi:phage major head subunit gpT-like protein